MYAHRFTSANGTDPGKAGVWHRALDGLTDEQVKAGLRALWQELERDRDAWPPSAPAFRGICLRGGVLHADNVGVVRPKPFPRSLPKPWSNRETGLAWLQQCKSVLRGATLAAEPDNAKLAAASRYTQERIQAWRK